VEEFIKNVEKMAGSMFIGKVAKNVNYRSCKNKRNAFH